MDRIDLGDPGAIASSSGRTPILNVPGIQAGGSVRCINDSPYALDLYLSATATRIAPRANRLIEIGQNPPQAVYWQVAYNGASAGGSDALLEIFAPGECVSPFESAAAQMVAQQPSASGFTEVARFQAYAWGGQNQVQYTYTATGYYRVSGYLYTVNDPGTTPYPGPINMDGYVINGGTNKRYIYSLQALDAGTTSQGPYFMQPASIPCGTYQGWHIQPLVIPVTNSGSNSLTVVFTQNGNNYLHLGVTMYVVIEYLPFS